MPDLSLRKSFDLVIELSESEVAQFKTEYADIFRCPETEARCPLLHSIRSGMIFAQEK